MPRSSTDVCLPSEGSIGSSCWESDPPSDSRLSQSLERGHFKEKFSEWEVLGSGGFGTVLKAWHIQDQCWYAVKMISARLKVDQTMEDNYEAWCGPEIFQTLQSLHSPHVVKYMRYWSELPSDLPCHLVASPKLQASAVPVPPPSPAGPSASHFAPESMSEDWTETDFQLDTYTDGGFEWATRTAPDDGVKEQLQDHTTQTVTPKAMYFRVIFLEQMEFCGGVTLASWLSSPELRPAHLKGGKEGAVEIFTEVMKGLMEVHTAGIVHCDIKPSNIMIADDGSSVKLFDFGTAKLRAAAAEPCRLCSRIPLSTADQEGSQTALGTPGYAPPEHCHFTHGACKHTACNHQTGSRQAGPGADIFSAGVILVEMLMVTVTHGAAWMTAMERAKAFHQVRTGRCSLPTAILKAKGVPGWLRQLAIRMVVWDAAARPSSKEILEELEASVWAAGRHNPLLGSSHPRSPHLAACTAPPTAAHNPYIGYFVDHRRWEMC